MLERIFDKSKKKERMIHHRPPKTDEQVQKELDRKDRKWARERVLEQAKTDPLVEAQYISKLIGIDLKPRESVDKIKQELNEFITKAAVDEIRSNPELLKSAAKRKVDEVIGSTEEKSSEGEPEYSDPVDEILDQIEKGKRLKEELGVSEGTGGIGAFVKPILDSEFGKMLAQGIVAMIASNRVQLPTQKEKIYVVQVDGQLKEMSEADYRKLLEPQIPRTTIEAPKEEQKTKESEVKISTLNTEEHRTEPELPNFLTDDIIQEISNYLELSPEEVVAQLESEAIDPTNERANLIWSFVYNTSYDQIVKFATPYENHSKIGSYVERILSPEGKVWVEGIIELVKKRTDRG